MDEQESVGLGELISFCRWLKGLSRARLGRKTGIDKSQIARYEADAETPRPATLQRIFQETGVSPRVHDFIRWCLRLIRQAVRAEEQAQGPPRQSEIREETQAAVAGTVERVLALARAELALLHSAPAPSPPSPPTEDDDRRVEHLWERLASFPDTKQRLLIEGAQAYRDWLLCRRICAESERTAADDPHRALKLAGLALYIARHVSGTDAWRFRLQGWCTGFLAYSQRACRELPAAEATFSRAWRLWRSGKDEAGLLPETDLHRLEASLRPPA
jgi:transcriptional regulator with XRE-family HTH domain